MDELERIEANYGCLQEYYRCREEEDYDSENNEEVDDLDDYDIFIESFYSERYGY